VCFVGQKQSGNTNKQLDFYFLLFFLSPLTGKKLPMDATRHQKIPSLSRSAVALVALSCLAIVLAFVIRYSFLTSHNDTPAELKPDYRRIALAKKMTLSVCTTLDRDTLSGKTSLFESSDTHTFRDLLLSLRYQVKVNHFDGISSFHLNYPFCATVVNLRALGGVVSMLNMMVVGIGEDVVMNEERSALCDNTTAYWPYRWKTISVRYMNETGHENLMVLNGRDAYLVQQLFWTEHGILPCDKLTPSEMINKLHTMHGLKPLWNPFVEPAPQYLSSQTTTPPKSLPAQ
jgi:hypothetical protein